MGLSHLTLATDTITFAGGSFAVRGLGLDDVVAVMTSPGIAASLNDLFTQVQADGGAVLTNPAALAASLAKAAPQAVSLIIARAADEPDASLVSRIPLPAQLEALEKICTLTFASEGSAKNLLETVIRMARGVTGSVGLLTQKA